MPREKANAPSPADSAVPISSIAAFPYTMKRCVDSIAAQGARGIDVVTCRFGRLSRPQTASHEPPQTCFFERWQRFPRSRALIGSSINPDVVVLMRPNPLPQPSGPVTSTPPATRATGRLRCPRE